MNNLNNIKYFVFCSGKTGSKTLLHGFMNKFGQESALHVHSANHFEEGHRKYGNVKNIIIENSKKFDKIYIIDSYREPIERGMASFFQNINSHCPNWKNMNVQELIKFFNTNKLNLLELYHSYYESWGYFGISKDINFDFEKGYVKKELDNKIFIKTRLQESNRWGDIFSEILNTKINFGYDNNSIGKPYYQKYKEFKNSYVLPDSYKEKFIEVMNLQNENLDPNNVNHLTWIEMKKMMTQEEINSYLQKWGII
jgi:hypothetical protein